MCSEPPHTTHHPTSTPTLPLSWLPVLDSPWMPTPPRLTLVSVPFLWEEAPGKPRPSTASKVLWQVPVVAGKLPPPPRLLKNEVKQSNNLPSPTTVLDGDERGGMVGSKRWGSFRMCENNGGGSGRFRRGRSASSLSLSSYATSSPFLVNIYESFKQVLPWRRRTRTR
ncbi:hypothetical protein IC582_022602 [Cucumis melo]|uniref:Uncharacterized protein n=1 Tax=Cucumis melo TaxID=3656 RepID=A0A9I9CMK2_CUCME